MGAAQSSGDEKAVAVLRHEQIDHYMWFGDIHLPRLAYSPPPVVEVKPAGQPIHVLDFGDFGDGADEQVKTAAAMRASHKEHPFDFGLTLGDNFYNEGLANPDDPRWQTEWEQLYGPMNIKFYPVFGNHDYDDPDSPAGELAYSKKSSNWIFPAPYYTFPAGPIRFFAIDNVRLSDEELQWLDQELSKSKAPWKLVYGHYQIYSATRGDNDADQDDLVHRLLPILKKDKVDIYLNGHDHNLQELQPESGVHFFVSGAGGAGLYDMKPTYKRSVFQAKKYGFTIIDSDNQHIDVIFVDMDGKELYRSQLKK